VPELGGHDDAVAPSAQCFAQHPLAQAELLAVHVGRVEERDARVERGVYDGRRALLLLGQRARPAEVVAAQTDDGDQQGGGAEGARFHVFRMSPLLPSPDHGTPARDVRFPRVDVVGAV
jgi:hypothetical protein